MSAAAAPFEIFRTHGGKVETARALFPQARLPWIDVSTGISPWSFPYEPLQAGAFTRLPDPESLAHLEAAAASSFGVADPARVVATPGSDLGLRVLGRIFANRKVAVVRPGYSGHVLTWEHAPISLVAAEDLETAARHHEVIVLANPNNPDGRLIERERLLNVAAMLAARSGALIVDEAFADVTPAQSLCDSGANGLILFRSFGKFFGLAGLRLGFVIAPPDETRRFRHALGDWPISGPAVAVGTAAYRDLAWQSMQRQRLIAAAARLDAMLVRAGLSIVGGTALYRLARCADADALFRHLAAHSILTRPFASDSGLLRVGLPGEEAHWKRLAAALDARRIA
jgi:cobalamin biosynthetic protein CobC